MLGRCRTSLTMTEQLLFYASCDFQLKIVSTPPHNSNLPDLLINRFTAAYLTPTLNEPKGTADLQ